MVILAASALPIRINRAKMVCKNFFMNDVCLKINKKLGQKLIF
jgi:hypothetical protein